MSDLLTPGFAVSVFDGSVDPDNTQPVVQVLSIKKISQGAGGLDRYRCVSISTADAGCNNHCRVLRLSTTP
jgi:hypothetical protein